MSVSRADFPIGLQCRTSEIHKSCSLGGISAKILWVTFGSVRVMCLNRKWIGPQTKIWEGAEVAETAMHCRAWDE